VSLLSRFWQLEQEDPAVQVQEAQQHAWANSVLALRDMDAFRKHLSWLEEEGLRPFVMGPTADMIVSGTRANVFREIRAKLLKDLQLAEQIIARAREGRDG
jgi:hypothetical protein